VLVDSYQQVTLDGYVVVDLLHQHFHHLLICYCWLLKNGRICIVVVEALNNHCIIKQFLLALITQVSNKQNCNLRIYIFNLKFYKVSINTFNQSSFQNFDHLTNSLNFGIYKIYCATCSINKINFLEQFEQIM